MTHTDEIKKDILKPDENLERAEKQQITPDSLFAELKAELEAEETKFFQNKGKVVEKKDVIAWKIRQDALEKGLKLLGLYPAEKHEHTGDVIFHSNVPEPDMPEKEEEEPPPPPPPEEEETLHVTDIPTGGTGTATNYDSQTTDTVDEIPIKEQPTPEHDQDKEFKDHHRSRREAGK